MVCNRRKAETGSSLGNFLCSRMPSTESRKKTAPCISSIPENPYKRKLGIITKKMVTIPPNRNPLIGNIEFRMRRKKASKSSKIKVAIVRYIEIRVVVPNRIINIAST